MASEPARGIAILIPARFASTRFPGKPLVLMTGGDGVSRTLVEHSWRAAMLVPGVDLVAVATDDERIAAEVRGFGGRVTMTPSECANGTERCAAAAAELDDDIDVVVNLQGDAPLTPPGAIQAVVADIKADGDLAMATPAIRCTAAIYRHLTEDARAGRVGGTTVVFNAERDALYFSKRVIPYAHDPGEGRPAPDVHLHLGVYAYRRRALSAYTAIGPTPLEQLEGLEQLRFLHAGMRVRVTVCEAPDWDIVEVNNPSDVTIVEDMLKVRDGKC